VGEQSATPPRITLIGRDGCHLCDEAREVVRRVSQDTGAGWVEQNVDADPDLLHRYGEMVPVVLVDGSQHDYFTVDEKRLRAALSGRRLGRWGARNR
jgi:hypothetical protein